MCQLHAVGVTHPCSDPSRSGLACYKKPLQAAQTRPTINPPLPVVYSVYRCSWCCFVGMGRGLNILASFSGMKQSNSHCVHTSLSHEPMHCHGLQKVWMGLCIRVLALTLQKVHSSADFCMEGSLKGLCLMFLIETNTPSWLPR